MTATHTTAADASPVDAATDAPRSTVSPKHTSLHAGHAALGATMTDFARLGHAAAVRQRTATSTAPSATAAGLFDLSHMGEIRSPGRGRGRS